MSLFDRLKRLMSSQGRLEAPESNQNMYDQLGIITPFTVLADKQFNSFIRTLGNSKLLNNAEQGAFHELWDAACVDMDGYGNNIWNLMEGCFEIYNKDDVIVKYEKKKAEVKPKYSISADDGRANFVYLSKEGNFVIHQDDRNNKVFLVYVSEDISDRLLNALSEAELEALELSQESNQARNRVGIPKSLNNAIIDKNSKQTIQERYRVGNNENHLVDLSSKSKNVEDNQRDER